MKYFTFVTVESGYVIGRMEDKLFRTIGFGYGYNPPHHVFPDYEAADRALTDFCKERDHDFRKDGWGVYESVFNLAEPQAVSIRPAESIRGTERQIA